MRRWRSGKLTARPARSRPIIVLGVLLLVSVVGACEARDSDTGQAASSEHAGGDAVWYSGGAFRLGGQAFRVAKLGKRVWNTFAVVRGGVVYVDPQHRVRLLTRDGQTAVIGHRAFHDPYSTPGSPVVAWVQHRPGGLLLVVYDTARMHRLGQIGLPAESVYSAERHAIRWVGDGTPGHTVAYYVAGEALWKYDWSRAGGPERLPRDSATVIDVAAGTWATFDGYGGRLVTFRDSSGTVLARTKAAEPAGSLSPDGRLYLSSTRGRPAVVDTRTGKARIFHAPLGRWRMNMMLTWAGPHTVQMLTVDLHSTPMPTNPAMPASPPGPLAGQMTACSTRTMSCQQVAHLDPLLQGTAIPAF